MCLANRFSVPSGKSRNGSRAGNRFANAAAVPSPPAETTHRSRSAASNVRHRAWVCSRESSISHLYPRSRMASLKAVTRDTEHLRPEFGLPKLRRAQRYPSSRPHGKRCDELRLTHCPRDLVRFPNRRPLSKVPPQQIQCSQSGNDPDTMIRMRQIVPRRIGRCALVGMDGVRHDGHRGEKKAQRWQQSGNPPQRKSLEHRRHPGSGG